MKINFKVLGTGCAKCKNLEKFVLEFVRENNLDAEVEKVEDLAEIMSYHIVSTPALVINSKVAFTGRIPSKAEIKNYIDQNILKTV